MTVSINHTDYHTPDSWNDCTSEQALTVYALLLRPADPRLRAEELTVSRRIELLQALTAWPDETLPTWAGDCHAAHGPDAGQHIFLDELRTVSDAVAAPFLTTDPDDEQAVAVNFALTRCLWPSLAGWGAELWGPADGLSNVCFYELCLIFTLLEQYIEAPDQDTLTNLLATVYRPHKPATPGQIARKYEGDRRLPLQGFEATIPDRHELMETLPPLVRQLLLFWLLSCRRHIVERFPNLFRQDGAHREKVGNDYGWGGLLLALADGLVHYDVVGAKPWEDAFIYLSYMEDQRKIAEMRAGVK